MTGQPLKRQRQHDAKVAKLEAERKRKAAPKPPTPTPEQSRAGGIKSGEARRKPKNEITPKDEAAALTVLRRNLKSTDEKVAHAAAVKIVEYTKGKPATGETEQQDTRIIFESAFVDPELADAGAE